MKQAAYTPIKSCTCVGNPCLELGDPIRFNTSQEIVETYILQRTLTGVQSKRDSIVSQGVENHSKNTNSMRETLANVQRRTSTLERNADHLLAQFNDLDENTSSQLEMTASQIQAEVMARLNSEAEISTRISQSAHSIGLTASGGDQSVGLTIQLYDENGNVIDTSSDNANITVTGFVSFWDLANAGSTTINGANITTGEISCDRLNGGTIRGQSFFQTGKYGDLIIDNGMIYVPKSGAILIGYEEVATQAWVCDSAFAHAARNAQEADYAANAGESAYATYAKEATTASYVANTASAKHTANMYSSSDNKMYYCPQGSSKRFKTDIVPVIDSKLDPHRLYDLNVVQFKYKPSFYGLPEGTPMETVIGIIAEDVEKIYPCAVEKDEDTGLVINWMERYLLPPMLSLIQEQHQEIEQLKMDNFSLHVELNTLSQRL